MGVFVKMSFLLFGFLLLHLCNGVSVKQLRVEEGVNDELTKNENGIGDQVKELMQRVEGMEKKLEVKNTEVEDLQKRMKEAEVQFESRVEEEIAGLKSELRMQIADFQNQWKAEVKSEVEKVLPTAVEKGLRDLPYEMVCAYQSRWSASNSIITYDRISLEFNNSDRPGGLFLLIYSHSIDTGADGSMNIETGVFTTVTSGYYIVTTALLSGFMVMENSFTCTSTTMGSNWMRASL